MEKLAARVLTPRALLVTLTLEPKMAKEKDGDLKLAAPELVCRWCKHLLAVHVKTPRGACSVAGCACTQGEPH